MMARPLFILVYGYMLAGTVVAGSLEAPAAPDQAGSAMYTLDDLYHRLNAGTAGTPRPGAFMEPAAGPWSTMHTLTEIMGKMPALDNANGATVADVLSGKTFWGLTGGAWGLRTGGMATQTPSEATTSQNAGYYNAFDLATVDIDLVAGNIKSGVSIFGVAGTYGSAPCACTGTTSSGGRWCNNGNGTVTDLLGATVDGKLTGRCLVWLQKADWGGLKAWRVDGIGQYDDAHTRAGLLAAGESGANLSDGSTQGDWRLPTANEFQSLHAGTEPVSASQHRFFTNVHAGAQIAYWSSTTGPSNLGPEYAWGVILERIGSDDYWWVSAVVKTDLRYVWPVRGGQ